MLECSGCGNKEAHHTRTVYGQFGRVEGCEDCMGLSTSTTAIPDVYLGSSGGLQTDENICDPKTGENPTFSSKREKAALMKKFGLRQADSAERQHGARPETNTKRTYFS